MVSVKPAAIKAPAAKRAARKASKPVVSAAPAPDARKAEKSRLVRDSFTMPEADFGLVQLLKQRTLRFERATKKSELLRAGLHVLNALDDKRLKAALDALQPLKPGRPKKTV
jgi:hypothetical protein